MTKILATLASLAVAIGVVASAQATTTASSTVPATAGRAGASADRSSNLMTVLKSKKRLTRRQLEALGFTPASRHQLALIKRLQALHRPMPRATAAGASGDPVACTTGLVRWKTWQATAPQSTDGYAPFLWAQRDYCYYYIAGPNEYEWNVFDNYEACTPTGLNCIPFNAYTDYVYQLYYYGTWYGPPYAGYPGYGPFPGMR